MTTTTVATAAANDLTAQMLAMGARARAAAHEVGQAEAGERTLALATIAEAIGDHASAILDANAEDVAAARTASLSEAKIDRLVLDHTRLNAIAAAVRAIAAQGDPVGEELARWTRPNGLDIARVRTPIGVIAIIYESRPNVTADAAALCLRAGNAAILRGGSEAFRSNTALHAAVTEGLVGAGFTPDAVQLVNTPDRAAVGHVLSGLGGAVDLAVPRGGRSLVERVQTDARVPVLGHLEGVCHVYVHANADLDKARSIVRNAKMRRTGVCGAAETMLIDAAVLESHGPAIAADLIAAGCALKGDDRARAVLPNLGEASEDDWRTEYLGPTLAVRVVDTLDDAVAHIAAYGTQHTDAIITENAEAARRFLAEVDSAIVMHNASTQFADGGEFGMGAEIGIATGRLHARGPVGAEQLTSFKYVVRGDGQVRP